MPGKNQIEKSKKERTYQCDACDKCFEKGFVLNRHKKTHKDIVYRCLDNACRGFKTTTDDYFKKHLRRMHKFSSEKATLYLKENRKAILTAQPSDLNNQPLIDQKYSVSARSYQEQNKNSHRGQDSAQNSRVSKSQQKKRKLPHKYEDYSEPIKHLKYSQLHIVSDHNGAIREDQDSTSRAPETTEGLTSIQDSCPRSSSDQPSLNQEAYQPPLSSTFERTRQEDNSSILSSSWPQDETEFGASRQSLTSNSSRHLESKLPASPQLASKLIQDCYSPPKSFQTTFFSAAPFGSKQQESSSASSSSSSSQEKLDYTGHQFLPEQDELQKEFEFLNSFFNLGPICILYSVAEQELGKTLNVKNIKNSQIPAYISDIATFKRIFNSQYTSIVLNSLIGMYAITYSLMNDLPYDNISYFSMAKICLAKGWILGVCNNALQIFLPAKDKKELQSILTEHTFFVENKFAKDLIKKMKIILSEKLAQDLRNELKGLTDEVIKEPMQLKNYISEFLNHKSIKLFKKKDRSGYYICGSKKSIWKLKGLDLHIIKTSLPISFLSSTNLSKRHSEDHSLLNPENTNFP